LNNNVFEINNLGRDTFVNDVVPVQERQNTSYMLQTLQSGTISKVASGYFEKKQVGTQLNRQNSSTPVESFPLEEKENTSKPKLESYAQMHKENTSYMLQTLQSGTISKVHNVDFNDQEVTVPLPQNGSMDIHNTSLHMCTDKIVPLGELENSSISKIEQVIELDEEPQLENTSINNELQSGTISKVINYDFEEAMNVELFQKLSQITFSLQKTEELFQKFRDGTF